MLLTFVLAALHFMLAATAAQTSYPLFRTHPAMRLMMQAEGIPHRDIDEFLTLSDGCTTAAFANWEKAAASRNGRVSQEDLVRVLAAYEAAFRFLAGAKFKGKVEQWSDFLVGDLNFRMSVGTVNDEAQVRMPFSILGQCKEASLRAALKALEHDTNQIVSALQSFGRARVSRFSLISTQYNSVIKNTVAAIQSLFTKHNHSLLPLYDALEWTHKCYTSAMVEYALQLSAADRPNVASYDNYPSHVLLKMNGYNQGAPIPRQSLVHETVDLQTILMLAQQRLSKDAFKLLFLHYIGGRNIDTSTVIKTDSESNTLSTIGGLLKRWMTLNYTCRSLGVASYWSAYSNFPVMMERFKGMIANVALDLVQWATEYERLLEDLQTTYLELRVNEMPGWTIFYQRFKSLEYPLSVILEKSQECENLLPSELKITEHYQKTLLPSKDNIFGMSQITNRFMQKLIVSDASNAAHKTTFMTIKMSIEGILLCMQSIYYSEGDSGDMKNLSSSFDEAVKAIEQMGASEKNILLLKKSLLLEKAFYSAGTEAGIIIMHFPDVDLKQNPSLLDHFSRRLVFAKSFFRQFQEMGVEGVKQVSPIFHDLIQCEMQMMSVMNLLEPLIFFVGQCAFSILAPIFTTSYDYHITHPTLALMMQADGLNMETVKKYIPAIDQYSHGLYTTLDRLATAPGTNGCPKWHEMKAALASYIVLLQSEFEESFGDSKFLNRLPRWISFLETVARFRIAMKMNRCPLVDGEFVRIPSHIIDGCLDDQVKSALMILEFDINQTLTAMRHLRSVRLPNYAMFCNQYLGMQIYTVPSISTVFTRHKHSLKPLAEAINWAHNLFKNGIIEYTATLASSEEKPISKFGVYPTLSLQSRGEGSRKTLPKLSNLSHAPVELCTLIQLAKGTLSKDTFVEFVRKHVRKIIRRFSELDEEHLADPTNSRMTIHTRILHEKSAVVEGGEGGILMTRWAVLFERWLFLLIASRGLGVSGYWSAYFEFPLQLERAVALMPAIIPQFNRWTVQYEEFMADLQKVCVDFEILSPFWQTNYNAFKSLNYPLSTILNSCQNYKPLPDSILMSFHSRKTILESRQVTFGLSPVALKFIKHCIATKYSASEQEYNASLLQMSVESALMAIQSQTCLRELNEDQCELASLSQHFDVVVNMADRHIADPKMAILLKRYLYSQKQFLVLSAKLNVHMHLSELDNKSKPEIIDCFVRHLAIAKSVYVITKTQANDQENARFELLAETLHDFIHSELEMVSHMNLLEPRIIYGTPFSKTFIKI